MNEKETERNERQRLMLLETHDIRYLLDRLDTLDVFDILEILFHKQ